jgi:hypothetical protein
MEFVRKYLQALLAVLIVGFQTAQAMEQKESPNSFDSKRLTKEEFKNSTGLLGAATNQLYDMIEELANKNQHLEDKFFFIEKKLSLLETENNALKKQNNVLKELFHVVIQKNEELKQTVTALEFKLSIPLVAKGYEKFYEKFVKGNLIYRPYHYNNDSIRIELPISALANPLEGKFDIPQQHDVDVKKLSISTGYWKEGEAENPWTVEVWFVPRFLIEKELDTTAQHFKEIFPAKWPKAASLGIFWTWGDSRKLNSYLILEDERMLDYLEKKNLFDLWHGDMGPVLGWRTAFRTLGDFMLLL